VVVPIGPGIPRRDRNECFESYCRLMLMLFKPWQTAMDLREGYCKWSNTFTAFMETLPHNHCIQNIINHMQILHECKDSHDEHFTQ
ncbi:hypothetical protein L208DRAFT_1307634, partial [Tricholoma matsutake]